MNTVSIVIPSWNAKVHLLACLSSIASFPPRATVEIIVVDNASTDGSPEAVARLYPAVRLIRNASNVGFAPAANQGLREATGSYLFLVNSDVVVTEGSFDVLMKFLDSTPRVALAGPLVCRPDGSIQENSRRRLPTLRRDFLQA
ncbi:MAG: glycosyltransferase family 2 protein, partial [Candidatus Hydrogenedentes bacterium]|nr:glycosyltransferase family 2 protein [Candidatus Hydrogenedentota bacterium]